MEIGIPFIHRPSHRAKRLTIRLDRAGQVIVTTPHRFPKYKIASFVESARDWIRAHQVKVNTRLSLLTNEYIYVFGKKYSIKLRSLQDGSIAISDAFLFVSPLNKEIQVMEMLSKWLKSRATEYITKRVYEYSEMMGLPFHQLSFRSQKTRWGSCSIEKNLSFNWKLIHAPKSVIDYVIIHELSHTKYMNHRKPFWDLVAQFDPNYPHHRRWLQKYGETEE